MYSQGQEEKYILDIFESYPTGRLAEIGAYNPETFSNSRALIERGWEAVLVEPSPQCFENLEKFYIENDRVTVLNSAIGVYNGELQFWDSGGACATAAQYHYEKWKKDTHDYKRISVPCITWDTFTGMFGTQFDFISIDTEGMDWDVLQQIDFDEVPTKMVCFENTYWGTDMYNYLKGYDFVAIHTNGENTIMVRK